MVDEWLSLPGRGGDTEYLLEKISPVMLGVRVSDILILTCVKTSLVNLPHAVSSNPLSKLKRPRLPFRQFPVIFNSSMVCTFCTCIFMLGPLGVFVAHIYRSSCRRASKYSALLQLFRSASSGSRCSWDLESNFESI